MTTTAIMDPAPRRYGRYEAAAVMLSLALHLAVAVALGWQSMPPGKPAAAEPAALAVELVPEAKAKPPPPPPSQEAPAPLPKPQLDTVPLADRPAPGSQAGSGSGQRPKPLDKAAFRSARDVMLSQVLSHWRPPAFMRGRGAVLTVKVDVKAGGMLGAPFGRDEVWNPGAAIDGIDQLPPGDPRRQALEGFYHGLRQAQPFRLPAEIAARLPFTIALDFRLDDLP
jgi:hypothetical protein